MKINNAIWIAYPKPKKSRRSKIPVETNPTNDFGGSGKIIPSQKEVHSMNALLNICNIEALSK